MNIYCATDGDCFEIVDYPHNDLISYPMNEVKNSIKICQDKCQNQNDCIGFSFVLDDKCYLKNKMENGQIKSRNNILSGPTHCPRHGNWSEYGLWTPCSKSCGDGMMRHFRFCNNPEPAYGGNGCVGQNYEDSKCFTDCTQGILIIK